MYQPLLLLIWIIIQSLFTGFGWEHVMQLSVDYIKVISLPNHCPEVYCMDSQLLTEPGILL